MKATFDFSRKDIPYYIILLSAPVLLTIYRYHGYPGTFNLWSDFGWPVDQAVAVTQFFIFFILVLVIPALYILLGTDKRMRDFGASLGDYRFGLKLLGLIPLVILPVIYFAAKMPDVRSEYPLAKSLLTDQSHLLGYELAYVLLYYIAWEFFFRGFILFGLKEKYGAVAAILIQTISSCLVHIDKPEGEIIGSIIVGILFGMIALRTRSIWYVVILHASIGVLTDLFIIYG